MPTTPWHLAIVVPARDEAAVIAGCITAIGRAVDEVPGVDVHVVVAADRCRDDTETVAARALAHLDASIVRVDAGNVGVARGAGAQAALRAVPSSAVDRVWIAMTDADSRVPVDWLRRHLDAAVSGWHAVVGGVAVDDWSPRTSGLSTSLARYRRAQLAAGTRPVHGANLGVSAAALTRVGGVPAQALSEDSALVGLLETTGVPVLWSADLVVRTSARRSNRAPAGFSTLLDELEEQPCTHYAL